VSTPRPESRLSELESEVSLQKARVRELHDDTAEELRAIRQDIKQLSDGISASYVSIGDTFMATWKDIETRLATKEDICKLETRFDKVEASQIEQGKRMDAMDGKLDQVLTLLQQKLGS
jgi:flagellar capping protein FliD